MNASVPFGFGPPDSAERVAQPAAVPTVPRGRALAPEYYDHAVVITTASVQVCCQSILDRVIVCE